MNELETTYASSPLDHDGQAACVLAKYPDLYKWTPQNGWLMYADGYWQSEGAEASVGRAVKVVLRERDKLIAQSQDLEPKQIAAMRRLCSANSGAIAGIKTVLKDYQEVEDDIKNFDQHPFLLNCANCVVDLTTGSQLPHSPEYLFTYRLSTAYNPEAKSKVWEDFLASLELPKSVIHFLQVVFGYALTGSTKQELMFYLWGPTRSGKGTITNTILSIMEELAIGVGFRMFTASRFGDTQNFDFAPLKSKRLVSASESNRDEQINGAVFKQATGGDPIWASFKGKDGFSFKPQWKLFLSSNFTMNADPFDNAIWARVRTVKLHKSFEGQEDRTLKDNLQTQEAREGVLAWMVQGAIDWAKNGIPEVKEIEDATMFQRLQASSVLLFVDSCCRLGGDERAEGNALYNSYTNWCHSSGYKPFGRKRFTQGLEDIGVTVSVQRFGESTHRYYIGAGYVGDDVGTGDITKKLFGGKYE
jgi:putative DNA primase/helicase